MSSISSWFCIGAFGLRAGRLFLAWGVCWLRGREGGVLGCVPNQGTFSHGGWKGWDDGVRRVFRVERSSGESSTKV